MKINSLLNSLKYYLGSSGDCGCRYGRQLHISQSSFWRARTVHFSGGSSRAVLDTLLCHVNLAIQCCSCVCNLHHSETYFSVYFDCRRQTTKELMTNRPLAWTIICTDVMLARHLDVLGNSVLLYVDIGHGTILVIRRAKNS